MDDKLLDIYRSIVGDAEPTEYHGAEEQGRTLKRFSILKPCGRLTYYSGSGASIKDDYVVRK